MDEVETSNPAEWTHIAGILGNDRITEIHLTNLLCEHGIRALMQGSRGYAVLVPSAKAAHAVQLLRADARNRDYHISFGNNELLEAPEPKEVIHGISV